MAKRIELSEIQGPTTGFHGRAASMKKGPGVGHSLPLARTQACPTEVRRARCAEDI
jgi:hypothetical protein